MIKATEAREIIKKIKERKDEELRSSAEKYCSGELSEFIEKQANLENNYCIVTPHSKILNLVREILIENGYQVQVVGLDSLKISW